MTTAIFQAHAATFLFHREAIKDTLKKMKADGWTDPDLTARQVVDDLFREGVNIQFAQHLVERLAVEGSIPAPRA